MAEDRLANIQMMIDTVKKDQLTLCGDIRAWFRDVG